MLTPLKNACSALKVSSFAVFSFIVLIGLTSGPGAFAQVKQIQDDPYWTCPAQYQSCDWTGTSSYFPPDPYDSGERCDQQFLSWDFNTGMPSESSCYGDCDYNNPTLECYVRCQDNYSGCLRTAFSLGARLVSLSSQDPRRPANISGNVYRSCLADRIPSAFATQYQQCRDQGRTIEDCCSEIAANFP